MARRPIDPRDTWGARAVYGAPPPPVSRPCELCGAGRAPRGTVSCFECSAIAHAMPALGLSIAAFCRRARVDALREDIAIGAFYIAHPEHPKADDGTLFRNSLRELCAMAREGSGG